MSEIFKTHGAFSWFELMTTDVESAISFYKKLFNWNIKTEKMDGGMEYNVVNVNDAGVAGIYKMPKEDPEFRQTGAFILRLMMLMMLLKKQRNLAETLLLNLWIYQRSEGLQC